MFLKTSKTLFFIAIFQIANADKVLVFKDDCDAESIEFSMKRTDLQSINQLTICLRFSLKYLQSISLIDLQVLNLKLAHFKDKMGFVKLHGNASWMFLWTNQTLLPGQWNHLCLSYYDNAIWMILNGELLHDDINGLPDLNLNLDEHGDQVKIKDVNLIDKLTLFNVWSKALSIQDMVQVTKHCQDPIEVPDLISWKGLELTTSTCHDFVEMETCQDLNEDTLVLETNPKSFEDANFICQANGGGIFTPRSMEDLIKLDQLWKHNDQCLAIWIGKKIMDQGNYYHDRILDGFGNYVDFVHWNQNQPNGRHMQKCVVLEPALVYNDQVCEKLQCFACLLPQNQVYQMRGQVPNKMDHYFIRNNDSIHGFTQSRMSKFNESWILDNGFSSKTTMNHLPPLGLKQWINKDNETLNLIMSQCGEDKFTCSTFGTCIPMSKRCNGRVDCPLDDFDEENCNLFELSKNYMKNQSPPTSRNQTGIPVKVQVHIKNVYDLNELSMDFKVRLKLSLSWHDSRITFKNLKENEDENIMCLESSNQLWMPTLLFGNSNNDQRTVLDDQSSLLVKSSSNHELNNLDILHQDYLFKGSENPLILSRFYTVNLKCDYDFRLYPFEEQTCPIILEVPFSDKNHIQMIMDEQPKHSNINFLQYQLISVTLASQNSSSIEIRINLDRLSSHYIYTTFIPTSCLIIIAELTLFIDKSHFEASIMVSLTSMLVMYTLYQSTSATLPQTAYMKLIDIWLFSGLIIPFIVFITLIIVDSLSKKEAEFSAWVEVESLKSNKFSSRAKKTILFCTIAFFLTYWTIVLYIQYQ